MNAASEPATKFDRRTIATNDLDVIVAAADVIDDVDPVWNVVEAVAAVYVADNAVAVAVDVDTVHLIVAVFASVEFEVNPVWKR